ncbi:MAG: lysylphosphatidylglycerol synthase transmembrane domain-containing protein [Gemmatimonadota bacterium]
MKRHWKAVLGIAISALLIWWALRDVDLADVWHEVRGANLWLLAAAVAVATAGFFLRALRWEVLLRPIRRGTHLGHRFAAVNIGFAANNVLPARVGEFARAWAFSRMEPVSISGAVGSLVAERFLDAVAILALLVVAVLHPSFPAEATVVGRPIGETLTALLIVVAVAVAGLVLLLSFPATFLRLARGLSGFLPGQVGRTAVEVLESFLGGLDALRRPGLVLPAVAWSLVIWSWSALSFWLGFLAFGIDRGFAAALFVQAIVAVGVSVPAAPGYFGTWHAAALVGLHEVYGVGEASTLAFAFGYHLGGFFPVTLLGLWYAGRLGMSFSELGKAGATVEEALDRELGS